MSQFKLEVAIDASPGSVSRIESGHVNPTKETLLKISSALGLKPYEEQYLLGTRDLIDEQDIENAKTLVSPLLSSKSDFCYLLDNKGIVIALSDGLQLFFRLNNVKSELLYGVAIEEVLFDPKFGIRSLIRTKEFLSVATVVISMSIQKQWFLLQEEEFLERYKRMSNLPDFIEVWNSVLRREVEGFSENSRTINFRFKGLCISTRYHSTPLFSDPRFTLVEFIPKSNIAVKPVLSILEKL